MLVKIMQYMFLLFNSFKSLDTIVPIVHCIINATYYVAYVGASLQSRSRNAWMWNSRW